MNLFYVKGEYITKSDLAIKVRAEGKEVWLPRSQLTTVIPEIEDLEDGDGVSIDMPQWLAEEKGLI